MASRYKPWTMVRDQLVLGSEAFARQLGRSARKAAVSGDIPKRQRLLGRPTIDEILPVVGRIFREKVEVIRLPRSGLAREAVAYLSRSEGAWPIAEIGSKLGIRSWSASHRATAAARRFEEDKDFRAKIERAVDLLRKRTT